MLSIIHHKIEIQNAIKNGTDYAYLYKSLSLIIDAQKEFKDFLNDEQRQNITDKQNNIKTQLIEYTTAINRLLNLEYDLKHNYLKIPYTPNKTTLIKEIDGNHYKIINKQIHYKDISINQILKILFEKHNINKFEYKNAVNKNIYSQNVKARINAYYSTIKTSTTKTTLKYLSKAQRQKPTIILNKNGLPYCVTLKKNYYFYKFFLNYADNHLFNLINTEFNNKFIIDNKFKCSLEISDL